MVVKKSFKEFMYKLNQNVKVFKERDLDIELGFKEFKKSIKLFQQCKKKLELIKKKTQVLITENSVLPFEKIGKEN